MKLALDWAVHRQVWRGQAVYIRSLFEANKDVRDPRQQQVRRAPLDPFYEAHSDWNALQVLLRETEKLLEGWKHPDPYRAPTAPGGMFLILASLSVCVGTTSLTLATGNKWERNLPARILPCTWIFSSGEGAYILTDSDAESPGAH